MLATAPLAIARATHRRQTGRKRVLCKPRAKLCSSIARFGPSTKSRRNPSTQTNAAGHRKENASLMAFQDGKMINLVVPLS
jgi:hypothetical protein